ncbi:MAG: hypothetical protein KDD44_09375 [Bdellovibrionales bacterium]|nr:hypothetical protein [Bdellovibrionales bacterium]
MTVLRVILCCLVLISAVGCSARSRTSNVVNNTTVGQEFLDLKRARDQNALSDDEYLRLRRKLLENADFHR